MMRNVHAILLAAACVAGCGRFGFDNGSFDTVAVSDPTALVGCSTAIAGDGDGSFGVVWHEFPQPGGNQHALMFARVTGDAELAGEPTVLNRFDDEIERVELHAGEQGFVAIYAHGGSSSLFAATIDREGVLVSTEEIDLPSNDVAFAAGGDGFLGFMEYKEILYAVPLGADGAMLSDPAELAIPDAVDIDGNGYVESPSVAHTDTGFHVVYEHTWGASIGYAHISDSGAVVSSWVQDFGTHRLPRIAGDGAGRFGVTWFDGDQLTEFGLDEGGAPLWSGVRQVVPVNRRESQFPIMAGGAGALGMVWESDAQDVLPQIVFRTFELDSVDPSASSIEPVTEGDHAYSCPQLARGPGRFAAAFRGEIQGRQQLFVGVRHD